MSFVNDNYDELVLNFKKFFGFDGYPFQIRVAQHLLQGKSVILQAPTGAGKTYTALFPFLYALQNLKATEFPRKMIYSVERRILVNNFEAEVKSKKLPVEASVLTGERPEDPEMLKPLIFTTIDQTLSSFLMTPYSLSARVANLNAGAVSSSYLVFDEAHLFDAKTALPTLMWMLQALKGITPSLLMTATFSKPVLEELAKITGGEIVTVEPDELKEIPAQATKKRYFETVDATLDAAAVLTKHQTRSIVVCNTVDRAQKLYEELEALKQPDVNLIMLHARFWQTDRKWIEEELMRFFGRRDNPATIKTGSYILIATQVIEVGVDITCENLHTELAPASSVLQRAGRCARHPNEEGTVYVYRVEKELPYKGSEDLFDPTFQNITSFNEGGRQPVNFEMEQTLINLVHTEKDTAVISAISANRYIHGGKIEDTLTRLVKEHHSDLIRDADSRSILVHSNPDELVDPYTYESFSMFDGSFQGKLKELQAQAVELGEKWVVKWPELITDAEAQQQIERRPAQYKWNDLKPADTWQPIVVVNPQLVSYDSKRGFRFIRNQGELCQSKPLERQIKTYGNYNYQLESYAEHIKNVNWAYGYYKFEDEIAFAAARLQERLGAGLPAGQIDRAIRLSFVFHDAGKLTEGWQSVVKRWQEKIARPVLDSEIMLAHTDFDWNLHNQLQREFQRHGGKRPPHAVEGAAIAARFLQQELKNLHRPVLSAIARHHAPLARELSQYKLHSAAVKALNEALTIIEPAQPWNLSPTLLMVAPPKGVNALPTERMVKASSHLELLVYMLIIRVLRLADQNSFSFYQVHAQEER